MKYQPSAFLLRILPVQSDKVDLKVINYAMGF